MPSQVSQLSLARTLPRLTQTKPNMPSLTSVRSLTSDSNGTTNTTSAAGSELLTRAVRDPSQITGLGGQVDFVG